MDYSLYHMQTGVKDTAYRGTPLWNTLYADLRTSYRDYFTRNYEGNRAPVYIGNHFSKWNDGLYWQAMQDFAREVCVKPEVKCVTFSELADFMDTLSPEVLARYQTGAFPGLKNTVQ